ncbi:hypothetical protein RHMOL_Rhmol11G0047000 [Rhododendron molle]|uniref:Uncharacterized protein n=1 Tax=Rhododendron molle TaxID=49168 RepID=A0ACC0LP44_RHOML|nr:hypothetical protein RHMOL_Rhmol11G0047000 [Rhododendron molle]
MLHTSKPSDSVSNGSDLISTTNNREPFIAEMRSELSDAQSNDLEVHSTMLLTPLRSTTVRCIAHLKVVGSCI